MSSVEEKEIMLLDEAIISEIIEVEDQSDQCQFIELDITQNLLFNEESDNTLYDRNPFDNTFFAPRRINRRFSAKNRTKKKFAKKLKKKKVTEFFETDNDSLTGQALSTEIVKLEIPDDNYLETHPLGVVDGTSNILQLEYGSGVSIYESVEACGSDNEEIKPTKKTKATAYR